MHIKTAAIQKFKRFTQLNITGLTPETKLVVLTGPNGCGKSSLFDAFRLWYAMNGNGNYFEHDKDYHFKIGQSVRDDAWQWLVQLDFYATPQERIDCREKQFYFRTAYRNSPDFTIQNLERVGKIAEEKIAAKMIDNDECVSTNYQRLVSSTIASLYDGKSDSLSVAALREKLIGEVRGSMGRVFDDLILTGPGNPMQSGSFYFEKGTSKDFHYKNLSGGEKSAFDLLLDFIVKREFYNNTVYCIDEPETHLHTRLQARLLEELFTQLPGNSQLWISTHSIGMMRKAMDLQKANPQSVAFLDFHNQDFDQAVNLTPVVLSRQHLLKNLEVALDDLAHLVAPEVVVLCEGKPAAGGKNSVAAEFDAFCYRKIFTAEFPNADFISVGNQHDVQSDRLEMGRAIQTLIRGTKVIRLIDRDDRAPQEITELQAQGVRVLSKRHLESYLFDDELLAKLCTSVGKVDKIPELLAIKTSALAEIVKQGKSADDVKSAGGLIYIGAKRLLELSQAGGDTVAFLKFTMLPLLTSDTAAYKQLNQDVFGA
jgi:predicted ATPase